MKEEIPNKNAMVRTRLRPNLNDQAFDTAIPKATTKRTFKATDKGRDLVVCEDADDMFDRLKPVLDDLS